MDVLSGTGVEVSTASAVFDWSYTQLSMEYAATFRRLGLHPTAEMSEAAATVLTGLEKSVVRRHLAALAEKHLVESVGRRRYRMHAKVHAYAAQHASQVDSPEERREALARLVTWYARSALAADRLFHPGFQYVSIDLPAGPDAVLLTDRDAAASWLNTELVTLMRALQVASEHRWHATAVGLAASMRFISFREQALWSTRLHAETLGVAAARASGNREAEGFLLASKGDTLTDLHRWEEADAAHTRHLELGRELGDPAHEGQALLGLGYVHRKQGHFQQAREFLMAASPLIQQGGFARDEAAAECNLGVIAAAIGEYQQAWTHAQRELVLRRQAGDRPGEAAALHNAAVAWQGLGDHRVALEWAHQALDLDRLLAAGEQHIALVLGTAAACLEHLGDWRRAAIYLREAIDLLTQLDDPRVEEFRARLRDLDQRV